MTPLLVPLHGIGSRQDLPLPFEYVLVGAALALAVSFVVLAFAWRSSRWTQPPSGRPLAGFARLVDHRATVWVLRIVVLVVWLTAGLALWFGQDRVTNPAFGFVYVWLWVGLVPLSLLAGPVWRRLNPVRTLLLGVRALPVLDGRVGRRALPSGLGVWPGALALVGFLWLELVQPGNNSLPVLQAWAAAWFAWSFGGALVWGEAWLAAADPFEVVSTLVGRLSPWRRAAGRVRWVNPLHKLAAGPHPAGSAAVVVVLLGGTAFDSFGATTGWIRLVQTSDLSPVLWGTAGLLGMIALVAATFSFGVRGLPSDVLAASVVPIVVGYTLGHYLSLLVLEGQRTAILLSDPLGVGWNLFGTAEAGISQLWLENPTATALVQLVAIVGGHLLGVLVAHDLAIGRLPARRTVTGQVPLLLVMVGYTVGGLTLLFSP